MVVGLTPTEQASSASVQDGMQASGITTRHYSFYVPLTPLRHVGTIHPSTADM